MIRLATAALFSLAMASCAATPTPQPTPATCQGAFAVAVAAEGLRPQLEALNQTVRTCGSIEEWEAMYTRFGDYWHYTDEARTVLTNMCLYSTEVNRTPFVYVPTPLRLDTSIWVRINGRNIQVPASFDLK